MKRYLRNILLEYNVGDEESQARDDNEGHPKDAYQVVRVPGYTRVGRKACLKKNVFLVELIIQKDIGFRLNISKKGIMTSFYLFNSAIFFETFDFFVKKRV